MSDFEQMLRTLTGMNAVAADAAYVCLAVFGLFEVRVLPLMAAQALLIYFLCRVLCGIEDLRCVAATVNVRLTCPVAVLTSDAAAAVHFRHFGVRDADEGI